MYFVHLQCVRTHLMLVLPILLPGYAMLGASVVFEVQSVQPHPVVSGTITSW